MVVDDAINMRRTIKNMLRQLKYVHIIEAEDGLDGWKILPTARIDMAIVDWNMPRRMTCIELLRKARAGDRFAKIPFIMITTEVDQSTIAKAAETEVDAYIINSLTIVSTVKHPHRYLSSRGGKLSCSCSLVGEGKGEGALCRHYYEILYNKLFIANVLEEKINEGRER